MPQFYTLLTDIGQAKQANAIALKQPIEITEMAIGDGGGSLPTPDSSAIALVNEVRRAPINTSDTDPDNPSWIVVEQVLPPDVGGWTIREIGIYDIDGDLIGIGNYPETYKPVLAEGSSRTQTVRFVLEVSDTSAVTLKVDPSVVLATREYVDGQRAEHEASRNHPGATETLQGMIKRATSAQAQAGSDNARAMTPARVHEAFNQFGLGAEKGLSTLLDRVEPGIYYAYGAGHPQATPGMPQDSTSSSYTVIAGRFSETSGQTFLLVEMDSSPAAKSIFFGTRFYELDGPPYAIEWQEIYHSGSRPTPTETERGMPEVATQAETNTGNDDVRLITPKKLNNWVKQATESAIGMLKVATQAQTNTGTDDTKAVTPLKLKNWVKQATESVMGMLRVATQAQTNAGTDDAIAVTPLKLLFGFDASFGASGYIALPSWLLGFTIQWGSFTASYDNTSVTNISGITYPIVFPSECYVVIPLLTAGIGVGAGFTAAVTSINPDSFDYRCTTTGGGYSNVTIRFLAIGR